jgi:hypothetical protein
MVGREISGEFRRLGQLTSLRPSQLRWWPALKNAHERAPRWLRRIAVGAFYVAAVSIPIGVGAYMFITHYGAAGPEYLFRKTYGTHPNFLDNAPPGMTEALKRALANDRWVILGSFLVLITCAAVFARLAFSKSGKTLSRFILAGVVVAAAANLFEDALIYWVLERPGTGLLGRLPDRLWINAPAAMATVKWSALVVAVAAVPAAICSVIRVILSYLHMRWYRLGHHGVNWWDDALPAQAPEPDEDDSEAAWRQAYFVPDAAELIADHEGDPLRSQWAPTALCLSGGGIRSACVAMGAMQAFAGPRKDPTDGWAPVLDSFDYVISVSGGGFSAGARVLSVQDVSREGATTALRERFSPGSVEFESMRRRCSYIAGSPVDLLRALGVVLKNLLASLLIVASSAVILGWLLGMFVARVPLAAVVPRNHDGSSNTAHVDALDAHPVAALAAIAIPVGAAVICVVLGLVCEWASASPRSTRGQARFTLLALGAAMLALLVFVLTVAGPGLMWLCQQRPEKGPAGAVGGVAAVVVLQYGAALMSMMSRKGSVLNPSRWLKIVPAGVVRLALVLLTLGVLLIAWLLVLGIVAGLVFDEAIGHLAQPPWADGLAWVLGGIALMTLLLSSFDVTSLSLHPFYRQRLGRTFAVRRVGGEAKQYKRSEATWLDEYGRTGAAGPKFVFAAAAAISDGDVRPAPGLNAVSYVMTADYVGGPALGWLKTSALRRAASARIQRDLTVQGAMAISGAAFASAMGRQSTGIQTLLALSGARLGTWLPNPTFVRDAKRYANDPSFPKALPSVRGAGYLYRELLGINKFDARLVQVTDGGHYENLGLVEALRRRCRLIYCIDGGGDTPPLLSGLADAIRLARFELGVEITMDSGGPVGVENLAPGSGEQFDEGDAFQGLNSRITRGAVVRGRIKYPRAAGLGDGEASTGWLIVAKAVLWRDLPDWVLTFAAEKAGAEFPHENTSDQWFTEGQFAAHTELGRRIAANAIQVRGDDGVSSLNAEHEPAGGSSERAATLLTTGVGAV